MKVIELDDDNISSLNNLQNINQPHSVSFQKKMSTSPLFNDGNMVPRVKKYLESNVDKTYIDINSMADDLQRTYQDYSRRKKVPFRHNVKRAYIHVMKSYGHENNVSSSEEISDEEGSIIDGEPQFDNSLNNQLLEMYKGGPHKPIEDNELIDISSDDDNENQMFDVNQKSARNGASTSKKQQENLILPSISIKPVSEKPAERYHTSRGQKRKNDNQYEVNFAATSKKKKSVASLQEPSITFKDIGGLDKVLEDVCKLLVHVRHPEVYKQLGISPPRGFLLHGPPGCGKTLLANAIAGELHIPMLKVAGPELVGGVSGESEERIRDLFERAVAWAPCILFIDEIDAITPNRQNVQKEMERRIVAQLLSCLDDLNTHEEGHKILVIGATNRPDSMDPALRRAGRFDREVCVGIPDVQARIQILKVLTSKLQLSEGFNYETIAKFTPGFVGADLMALAREAAMAAVNRVFNDLKEKQQVETAMAIHKATQDILQKQKPTETTDASTTNVAVSSSDAAEIEIVDSNTNTSDNGIVVIDDDNKADKVESEAKPLNNEEKEKVKQALQLLKPAQTILEGLITWLHDQAPLTKEQLSDLFITMEDFGAAIKLVQPSAKREGFATVPDVTWDDIGSLRDIREELQMAILAPVKHVEQFTALGLTTPTGVLLCGPPGCGKTLLAKAIANEAGINFISVKGPELLNMYVGESEKAVRVCFERARNSAPCVIFFDELDSLCPKRSETGEGGVTMRVVNQMLTEMDGVEGRTGVYLLAATNRPDIVDPAVLRPGRLDKIIYVGLPTAEDRVDILRAITKNGTKPQLASDVDLEEIGKSEKCTCYTGADLAALVREAGVVALMEFMVQGNQQPLVVTTEHFKRAIAKIRPSISEKDQKHYEKLKKIYSVSTTVDGEVEEMEYS